MNKPIDISGVVLKTERLILRQWKDKESFAIELNGKIIGFLDVKKYGEKSYPELENLQGREFGYMLSEEYWGRGFMPEAVKAVIEYLFTVEKLDFILCGYFVGNTRSARVIEKCGFKYYKTLELTTADGEKKIAKDSILYNPGI